MPAPARDLIPAFRQPFDFIDETTVAMKAGEAGGAPNSPGHPVWLPKIGGKLIVDVTTADDDKLLSAATGQRNRAYLPGNKR